MAVKKKKTATELHKEFLATAKKRCVRCGRTLTLKSFYISRSTMSKDNRGDYCKECVSEMLDMNNMTTLFDILKHHDVPFKRRLWDKCFSEPTSGTPLKTYLAKVSTLSETKLLKYNDSDFDLMSNTDKSDTEAIGTLEVTEATIEKWGMGYTKEEYFSFERKYNTLKDNYKEKTSLHTEALLNYIRYRVKEEMATAANDIGSAKQWGTLATKAATDAKINPSQLSAADLMDGMSTFGQLSKAIEEAVDIVEVLPRFKERPQDKVDFTIWCYINYIRDLQGLPLCSHEEVYKFYDKLKEDFENGIKNAGMALDDEEDDYEEDYDDEEGDE